MILAITMTIQHHLKLQNRTFQENKRLEGDLRDSVKEKSQITQNLKEINNFGKIGKISN